MMTLANMTKINIEGDIIALQCTVIGKRTFIRMYYDGTTILCADIAGVYSAIHRIYGIVL